MRFLGIFNSSKGYKGLNGLCELGMFLVIVFRKFFVLILVIVGYIESIFFFIGFVCFYFCLIFSGFILFFLVLCFNYYFVR